MKTTPEPVESLLSADALREIVRKHADIAENPELIAVMLELHPDALVLASQICLHDASDHEKEVRLCTNGLSTFMSLLIAVGMELQKRLSEPGTWKN